jgi:hypothetical protein
MPGPASEQHRKLLGNLQMRRIKRKVPVRCKVAVGFPFRMSGEEWPSVCVPVVQGSQQRLTCTPIRTWRGQHRST